MRYLKKKAHAHALDAMSCLDVYTKKDALSILGHLDWII